MDKNNRLINTTDLDIKLSLGNIILNILFINYEPPVSSWGYRNHCHSSYELHFIPSGKGHLHIFDKTYNIEPGTFYITGPGVYHEQKADNIDPMSEYCINFEINVLKNHTMKNDIFIQSEIDEILSTLLNTNFWFGKDDFNSIELFTKIRDNIANKPLGYYLYIQNLLSLIIINAIRSISNKKKSSYTIPAKILNDHRRHIIDDYFFEVSRSLNREELADRIGTSVRQLNRIMHQYYSLSFKDKLLISRLENVKKLLLNSELSISEIYVKSGFSSISYFNKVFKEHFKLSPSDFRKKYKSK